MDEAFSALDPLIRPEMQEQLVELQAELGRIIVFITHDLNEAMFLGDRIAMMRDGRIVQIGTPEEILTDPANDYVAQCVQDVDRTRVLTASSVMEPPAASVPITVGPRGALKALRDAQTSTLLYSGVRDPVGLRLVGDLRIDERRAHVAGVDAVRGDAVRGALERRDLREPLEAVLRGDVGGLEGGCAEAVHAREVMTRPKPRAHMPGSEARISRNGVSSMRVWTRRHISGSYSWIGATR